MEQDVMKLDKESLDKFVEFFKLLAQIESGNGKSNSI